METPQISTIDKAAVISLNFLEKARDSCAPDRSFTNLFEILMELSRIKLNYGSLDELKSTSLVKHSKDSNVKEKWISSLNNDISFKSIQKTNINNQLISLKDSCFQLLNVELDKRQTLSAWYNKQLNDDQIKYAVKDAFILLQL